MSRLCVQLSKGICGVVIAALFAAALCAGTPSGFASKIDPASVSAAVQDDVLSLTMGMADVVELKGAVSDVMVANPTIADVTAIQSNRLYVVGANVGSTNIIVLDGNGDVLKRLIVHVKIDDGPIQRMIDKIYPDEDVTVHAMENQVVLTGTVSTPDIAYRVAAMTAHYVGEILDQDGAIDEIIANNLKVAGKSQVMLRVRIMEVSRNRLKETSSRSNISDFGGVLGNRVGSEGGTRFPPGTPAAFTDAAAINLSQSPLGYLNAIFDLGSFGPLDTVITALEEDGISRVLAEPNLTAVSGEQAGFLAGGEFPVPAGKDQDGNIIIEFKRFGVSLNFRPTVLNDNRISLQLETEVSSVARDQTVTLVGLQIPGLDVRRASTVVELGSGSTLMMAGLLQSQTLKNMQGLPGIRKLPILGDLMGSDGFRREETELVLLVSPYLVEPFGDKKQAKIVREKKGYSALASAFSDNIKRTFGKLSLAGIFDEDRGYGYIIE